MYGSYRKASLLKNTHLLKNEIGKFMKIIEIRGVQCDLSVVCETIWSGSFSWVFTSTHCTPLVETRKGGDIGLFITLVSKVLG